MNCTHAHVCQYDTPMPSCLALCSCSTILALDRSHGAYRKGEQQRTACSPNVSQTFGKHGTPHNWRIFWLNFLDNRRQFLMIQRPETRNPLEIILIRVSSFYPSIGSVANQPGDAKRGTPAAAKLLTRGVVKTQNVEFQFGDCFGALTKMTQHRKQNTYKARVKAVFRVSEETLGSSYTPSGCPLGEKNTRHSCPLLGVDFKGKPSENSGPSFLSRVCSLTFFGCLQIRRSLNRRSRPFAGRGTAH